MPITHARKMDGWSPLSTRGCIMQSQGIHMYVTTIVTFLVQKDGGTGTLPLSEALRDEVLCL